MASKKKLLQAAAGAAGGAALDIPDVFSTFLYDGTGTGSNLTVTNNIDLSTEGGLVWVKNRDATAAHALFDTVRGQNILESQSAGAQDAFSAYGGSASASYNTNGFGINGTGASNLNQSGVDYVSWTFRKAPKFFDVVTYTGNGTHPRTISHNLGSSPGAVIIKKYSGTDNWNFFHRGLSSGVCGTGRLYLNATNSTQNSALSFFTPSSTSITLGSDTGINDNGATYVAYLFAHHNNDGGFGPDSDQDIIKCGSYTGNGSTTGPVIDLGFEPQWLLIRHTDANGNSWFIVDNMRGAVTGGNDASLSPNTSNDEQTSSDLVEFNATGFQLKRANDNVNGNGNTYIYMAIRRGPLAAPTDATKVFAIDDSSTTDIGGYTLNSNFPVDFYFFKNKDGGDSISIPRLTVGDLRFNSTGAEDDRSSVMNFDSNTGVTRTSFQGGIDSVDYAFRRAPGFFDVVAYTGTGSNRTIAHNLGAVPEMMWVKKRSGSDNWKTFHANLGGTKSMELNTTVAAETNGSALWNSTAPTASVFTLGSAGDVNSSSHTYIACLFATVAGVSKVGSYSGNGSDNHQIDCGFSSGARFVLIKRTDVTEGWKVHDSVRGIVAGDDPFLELNNTNAENSSFDVVDPYSGGFAVNNYAGWNASGGSYIFYAIA